MQSDMALNALSKATTSIALGAAYASIAHTVNPSFTGTKRSIES